MFIIHELSLLCKYDVVPGTLYLSKEVLLNRKEERLIRRTTLSKYSTFRLRFVTVYERGHYLNLPYLDNVVVSSDNSRIVG